MAIYLDSASVMEAETAVEMGWIKGITTNPTLLAKSDLPPGTTLQKLAEISPGMLYYQLTASDLEEMLVEGRAAYHMIEENMLTSNCHGFSGGGPSVTGNSLCGDGDL